MLLEDFAHCDIAVRRLRAGDKRVFQCGPMGELKKAWGRTLDHSLELLIRIDRGDIGIKFETTPLWDEFAIATYKLGVAWGECSSSVLQPDYMGEPTRELDIPANDWFRNTRPPLENFPADLPEVPNPINNVLARSGEPLECSGIWEPVDVPVHTLLSLFRPETPKGSIPSIGAMAYLHGGTFAPRKVFDYSTPSSRRGQSVNWRLLWRDDRYEDGTIPEEEKDYVFLNEFVFPYPDALAPKSAPKAPVPTPDQLIVIESGQPAPEAGRWLLEGNLEVSVQLDQGEAAPLHEGRKVRWVLAVT
jgi:hypothetical protein